MTQFHTDDYIEFLHRINPENANNYAREQQKCQCPFQCISARNTNADESSLQTMSEMIARFSMDCSSIVLFQRVVPWVS